MSWRERYKNHEARFDHHIKAFQQKNKLSRQAVPIGSEAMFMNGMEDLDDFGTDSEEEARRPQGKRAARVDSDTDDDEDEEPARARAGPAYKATTVPKPPASKRKRASDANDRTPKRSKVTEGGDIRQLQGGNSTGDRVEAKQDDAMDQDSQGEETLEVEQNLFCPSDEDSLAATRFVLPPSRTFLKIYLPIDHIANLKEGAHRNDLPNLLGPVAQLHPIPTTIAPPQPVNLHTGLTAPKTLP